MFFRSLIVLLFGFLMVIPARAHELPQRVIIQMIAVAESSTLDLMVRVPLEAMRDVDFPLTPQGYLILDEAQLTLETAAGLWIIDNLGLRERGKPVQAAEVQVRPALPGDFAFASPRSATEHFAAAPLTPGTQIFWQQAMLDVRLRYALSAVPAVGDLTLDIALRHLGETTRTELLFVEPSGKEHMLSFNGDARDLPLLPSLWGIAGDFFVDGFKHILSGVDHLLFLLCLVLPLRRFWPLVKALTAFTLAHSITLCAAALGWIPQSLWFAGLVEFVIALSIVYLAIENMLRQHFRHRWVAAFVFGLAHGFGFAAALSDSLQFAQGQIIVALGSFNLGVEFGQLLVLAIVLPPLLLLFRVVESERIAIIVLSALVAHTAWHWMSERFNAVSGYFF